MARSTPVKRAPRKRAKKRAAPPTPMVRTSERTVAKRCAWQWDRTYNEHRKPVREAPALRFGTLVHAALEKRYPPGIKRGPKPAQTFEKLFVADLAEAEKTWGFYDEDGKWAEAGQMGVSMLEHYFETFGKDEEWRVLASEMTFRVPVYTPPHPEGGYIWRDGSRITKKRVLFYYVGTMDGVWQNRMDEGVRINDYKTCKGDPTKEAEGKATLDEQGTAYWTWGVDWLVREQVLKPRQLQALDGMLYTFLRKVAKDNRPQNAAGQYLNQPTKAQQEEGLSGDVSKNQPAPFFHRELVYRTEHEQGEARKRAIEEFMWMESMRRGEMPIFKSPGMGYPDQQCRACPVRDVCELHEMGADWKALAAGTLVEWDPYAAHEIEEEGKW